ncbi:thioesterase II family protein [Streptomyces durhamensis]|uniref:thioesterase II family protein n=1 Tax=Streptomyces durhamensis TaxID=68194 RepID=UPI00068A58AF|nr:alpha/beta fold hydrolase [Streptomyces durhamensis]
MSGPAGSGGTGVPGTPWLRVPDHAEGRIRLFCFPFAGGGAAAYRPWVPLLADVAQVLPLHLPGREARRREALVRDIDVMARAVADALAPWCREPYAFYGHSMGALLAHRTVAVLQRRGLPLPALLFAAARRPPHMPPDLPLVHPLNRRELAAKMRNLGATPERILEDEALLDIFLPVLRADFEMGETASPWRTDAPLAVPIVAMGGQCDGVRRAELSDWRLHTSKSFACRMFAGGHFFHLEHPEAVTAGVRQFLAPDPRTLSALAQSGHSIKE